MKILVSTPWINMKRWRQSLRPKKRLIVSDVQKKGEDTPDPQEGTLDGEPLNKPEEKQETDTDQKEG
jgi:hypothetical protein